MNKLQTGLIVGALSTLALTACASTPENLAIATASALHNNTDAEQVHVTSVKRGATTVSWKAETPSGHISCNADDMVRQVACHTN